MINNPYYSVETQGHYELADIGDLRLEEGGTIRNCRLGYATFGTLNADKSNAILVPTWYSGTHQIMGQVYIGKGPNDLLCMAWKWQRGDVSRLTNGDLEQALRRIKAKTFVMPIDTDMFFPPSDCEFEQKLIPNGELRLLHTVDGHLGLFGADPEYIGQVDRHLRELLAIAM